MWDDWNPVKDIANDWSSGSTIWGKLKVILFYSFVWLLILSNVYTVFYPLSFGSDCFVTDDDTQLVSSMIRSWSIYFFGFALYVVRGKTTLSNMRVLFGILLVDFLQTMYHSKGAVTPSDEVLECYKNYMIMWYVNLAWPLLAMICAYVERRVDPPRGGGGSGESQPLNP